MHAYIIGKYARLAKKEAGKEIRATGIPVNADDLFMNMVHGILTASNRFNSDKGPLAPTIRTWLMDAALQPQFDHCGTPVAYTIPSSARRRLLADDSVETINYASSVDEPAAMLAQDPAPLADVAMEQRQNYDKMAELCIEAGTRFACLSLDILPKPSIEDKRLMAATLKGNKQHG